MKKYTALFSFLILGFLFITACGDDDNEETSQEARTRELSKTWEAGTVSIDGSTVAEFNDFSITFNAAGTYSTTGYEPNVVYFDDSGTWSFASEDNVNVVNLSRAGGGTVAINISNVNENALVFSTSGPGVKATDPDNNVNFNLSAQ